MSEVSETLCRLCLDSVGEHISVLTLGDDGIWVSDKIRTLFDIDVFQCPTEFKGCICAACFIKISNFYSYHQQVLKNNESFLARNNSSVTIVSSRCVLHTATDNLEHVEEVDFCDVIEEDAEAHADAQKEPVQMEVIEDTIQSTQSLTIIRNYSESTQEHNQCESKPTEIMVTIPEHLRQRISKSKGDAKIKEFVDIKCLICGPQQPFFDTFKSMQMHYEKVHKTRGYIMCCGKKIYRKDRVMDHITVHMNPNAFKCPVCNHSSKSRVLLRIHLKQHLPPEEWPFVCQKCSQRFVLKSQLTNHEATHLTDEEKKFICDECGKVFALKFVLIKHKLTHSREHNYFCEICAKSFSSSASLMLHMKQHGDNHTPNQRVQCKFCGKSYKNGQSLRTHEQRHRDTREHKCDTCGKECSSRSSLLAHVRYVHTKVSLHKCGICRKMFRRKPELREHMARHTGEVLYKCSYCPKTFHSSSNYFAHRKNRHLKEYSEALRKQTSNVEHESS